MSGYSTNAALDSTVVNAHSGGTDGFVIKLSGTGGGTPLTASDTAAITVSAVNDAPTVTNPGTQTVDVNTNLVLSGLSLGDVDVASGNLEVTLAVSDGAVTLSQTTGLSFTAGDGTSDTTMTFQGTLTDINNALNNLTYLGDVAFDGVDNLTLNVSDLGNTGSGGAQVANDSVRIEVGNQGPTITNPGTQAVAISSLSIADSDAASGNLELTLGVSTGTLDLSQTTGLSFTVGDGTADATMTFQGTLTDINAAINGLVYNEGFPSSGGSDTLTIDVDDLGNTGGGGAKQANDSLSILVENVNTAPTIAVPGAQVVNEDTDITVSGISVTDSDVGDNNELEVTLGVSNGTLTLGQTTGLTFSVGDGSADSSMTFRGSLSDINTAVAGLVFRGTADFSGSDTLTIDVSDLGNTGSLGGILTDSDTVPITVSAVNDAPAITNPGAQSTNEGVDKTITSFSFSDVDVASGNLEVTLTVANGTMDLSQTTGLSFTTGTGTGDTTMTFQGTLSNINAAVNNLVYHPNGGFSGLDSLTVSISDLGNTGSGGAQVDNDTIEISVRDATNTAPTITNPGAQAVAEDTDLTITTLSIGDIDAGAEGVEVTVSVNSGALTLSQTTGLTFSTGDGTQDASMTFQGSVQDINDALNGLVYRGNTDFNGSDTLSINVNDLGNGSSSGGGGSPAVQYVTYVGTSSTDRAFGIAANSGSIFVTGTTAGQLTGETQIAATDGFIAKFSTSGALQFTHQFGGAFDHSGNAITFDADGTNVLTRLGLGNGETPGDSAETVIAVTTVRPDQFFTLSVNGAAAEKVTIEDDDSLGFLVFKINSILGTEGRASIEDDLGVKKLQIKALDGNEIEIIAGADGFDALGGLGLTPARLFGEPADENDVESATVSAFALGIIDSLSVLDKTKAADADTIIDNALREIRDAFRFITEGPEPEFEDPGSASALILRQIAALQDALARIQAFNAPTLSGTSSLFNLVI